MQAKKPHDEIADRKSESDETKVALQARNTMAFAHAVQHLFAMCLPPLLVFIHNDLQFTWTQLGVIVAVGSITTGLIQLISGFLVDKLGVKRVLVAGFSLLLFGLFLLSRSQTLPMMILSQFFFGVGNSTFHPASFAEVSKATRGRGLGMGMALHNIGGNVGAAAAYSIAAVLATIMGWRSALITMISGGAALTLIFALKYEELPAPDEDTEESETAAASDGEVEKESSRSEVQTQEPAITIWMPVVIVAVAALLSGSFSRGLNTFLPTFLTTVRGSSPAVAGMLSTIMLLSGAGGSFLGGKLGDELDRRWIVLVSAIITALLVVGLVQLPITGVPLILILVAIGFALSVARPCLNAITSEACPTGKTGTAFGIVFGVMSLGGSAITPVVGYITDHYTLRLGFLVLAVSFLLHGILMMRVKDS